MRDPVSAFIFAVLIWSIWSSSPWYTPRDSDTTSYVGKILGK